ncbi:hypothetical protein C8R45DRAFT_1015114 [Mycena sanguinolenta]|nr:hypothetical protein C8R45DRAFT_1015114 [Mycena sanguinolenta]
MGGPRLNSAVIFCSLCAPTLLPAHGRIQLICVVGKVVCSIGNAGGASQRFQKLVVRCKIAAEMLLVVRAGVETIMGRYASGRIGAACTFMTRPTKSNSARSCQLRL